MWIQLFCTHDVIRKWVESLKVFCQEVSGKEEQSCAKEKEKNNKEDETPVWNRDMAWANVMSEKQETSK